MSDEIAAAVKQAQILEKALQKATTDKGLSFRSLNSELQKAGTTASEMVATLAAAGPAFAGSLDSFLGAFATADRNLIGISSKIKEMQRVMTQSIKFTAAAQIQQFVSGQIQEAISWVKELNSELNTIAIVSGKSAEAMDAVYESVIRNAKELRVAADDYAYAAQIFYQQGLGDDEVERRAQITIKAAQAAGQSTQEMSQQLTAVWNTYNMQGEQLERAASVGARMGAETAVEFKDIATAMQISASAAAQMGVEYDMLASIIATVGDTTQQSASVIGNAYKTIFSRFDQLVSSGTDGEVTLGRVSQQLSNLGVKILDENGELVNLGNTIMDLGNRWDEYSQKQQIALAEAIGGTRQFGQVLALFNNWDKFMANYQSAQSEMGSETLEAQYLTSLDSIESAAINAGEAWSRAFSNIFQEDSLKGFYNGLEEVGNILDGVLEGFGGLPGILALIGAYMSRHLLTGVQKISQEWRTFQENLTPQRQLAAANAELDKMSAKVKEIHFNGVGTKTTTPEYQDAVSNNEYDQKKLDITREVTQATIKLNDIEKTATQETKNKVQYLREALTLSQQNANQAINNLKTERESAKNQEVIIQAMQRRVAYLKQMAANTIEGSDNYAQEAEDLENLTNLTQDLNNVRKATNDLSPKGINDFSMAIGSMANSVKNIKGLEGFSDQLTTLQKSIGKGSGTIVDSFGDFNAILDDMIISIDGNDAASKRMRQTLQTYQSQLQSTIQYQQQLRNALADTSNFANQIDAAFKLSGTSLQAFSQSLMTAISSVSMLGLQFSALWRTIESGDASFGAIALQLGLLVPSLINTGKMVKELIASFVSAMTKLGAQKIGTEQYTAANDRLTKAIERQRRAQEKLNAARAAGNSKRSLGQLQRRVNEAEAEVKSAEAEVKAKAPAKGKAMGAGMLETAKNAGSKILGVLRAIPPQAYIAAAAIAAIVLIYNEWEKTTAEAKMERMAKAAQGLKEQADEAQQTADNLRTTIESYDSAVDTLNNCVRGTEEWNEALKKVNESALEVVNSLDFMALSAEEIDDLYSYQDGMLTFNEDLLDKAQQSADAEAARAQYASSMAQADLANQQRMVNTKTDIRAIKGNSELGIAGGAAAGAGIGAAIGTIVPVIGNAVGAAVGAGIGAIAGGIAGNNIGMNIEAENAMQALYDNIDKLSDKTGTELVQELTRLGFSSTEVSQNLDKYTQIVAEVSAATQAYEAQIRAATAASVETQLGDEYDATTKAAVTEQVIATQDAIEEDLSQWIDDSFNKADIFNAAGAEDSLLSRYNAAAGTNYTADGNFSRGTDNNRTFAFKDETGELIELTKEQVVSTIAASEALQDLGATADETAKMLARLDAGSEAATDAIRDFITNRNLDTATKGEYEQIQQGVEESGSAKQYLIDIGFNEDLAEQYASQLEQSLDIDWEGTVSKFKDTLNNIDSLSVGAAKNIQETFDKISYGPDGEEAAQSFIDGINNLYSQVDLAKIMRENDMNMEEAKEYVMNALGNIDWDSYEVDQQIVTTMRDLGVEVDTTTEEYKEFIAELRHSTQAMPDFSKLAADLQTIASITKDIEIGSIVSEEDYQTLVAMNAELEKYFMLTTEGYKVIGGVDEIQEGRIEEIKAETEAMRERAEWAQNFNADTNWVLNDSEGNKIEDFNWDSYAAEGSQYANSNTLTNIMNSEATMELANNLGWTKEELQEIKDGLDAGGDAAVEAEAKLKSFAGAMAEVQNAEGQTQQLEEMLASTATDFAELDQMLRDGEIGAQAYGKALAVLEEEATLDGLDTSEVEDYAEYLMDVNENLEENEEMAKKAAATTMKMNRGVEDLSENFEDWNSIIEDSNEESQEYFEAMDGLKEAVSDLTNVTTDYISNDFIVEHMDDIEAAATGDAAAIDRLKAALADDIVAKIIVDNQLTPEQQQSILTQWNSLQSLLPDDIEVGMTLNGDDAFVAGLNQLIADANMTQAQVNELLGSMGYEATYETTPQKRWVDHPDTYVTKGQIVLGPEPSEPGQPQDFTYTTTTTVQDGGGEWIEEDVSSMATAPLGETPVVPQIKSLTKMPTGSSNNYSPQNSGGETLGDKSGGGGGGSKPTKKKAEKRDSMKIEDRYSTVKAAIDDVQREMDKFSANQDDMWGGAKLNALKKYNKELRNQAGYYRELVEQAKGYLETEDKPAATDARQAAANALGAGLIGIEYYEEGYVKNRTEIINQLDDLLQAKYDEYYNAAMAYDAAVDAGTATEAQSEAVDNLKTEYEDTEKVVNEYVEALDQIDDTAKEAEEALQKLVEAIREEIANKVEEITYKIELQVEINDLELEQIERTIEHLGDVGVITGRKFGLLSQSFKESQENANLAVQGIRQLEGMINNLNTAAGQEQFIKVYGQEAWDEYAASGVLPEEAIDGIKGYISDLTSTIDDMYSKMEDLFDTYLDALEMFADKFDQIADKLSHNIDKLDTYQEILEFSGQGWTAQGQTARNTIAQARVSTTQANLQLATSEYETYKSQYDDWMSEVEKFQDEHGKDIANYDEATAAAWNKIEETRQELYSKMNEAEGEIYSNMQELVSNIADAIEVGAEVITEQISDSLGGMFYDFDSMMDEYNQREELRLFFLEDYDKTYQLESLLRDIDDVMDDVTDPGRLQEYQSLIDEINAANEEGVQITQNDVDLLKAKFELQKAQDAYEEQMNAKNTMRLARDASGNWNYVYSQDQSQTEDAAQALADAQYNYDKLLHEVRDESSELWLQTQQEFFQWQQEIDQSRLQWDTQYREQVERTTKYYLELTQRYADQVDKYNNLLGESYSSTTLGVVTGYDKMQDAQFDYSEKHKEYNSKLEQNTVQWEGVMQEECKKVGLDYNNLAKDVTSAASNIMAENTALEGDVKSLQQTANTALTNMQKNVWSNVNSMISAIKALEAELQRAIQLLQTLTNKSLMSGYDENTDYTDYLHTDYAAYTAAGGKMGMSEWLDMYHSQDIWERMGAGADRGIYAGKDYEEAKDLIIDSYSPDATYINGNQYNFGEGTSGKYLNDWSNIKDQEVDLDYDNLEKVIVKGKRASGGIVDEHGLYELAEDGTEFVLNPDDTKNILSAVKAMREVVRMKMSGLDSALGSKTNEVVKKTVVNKDIQQLDQQVHIDATFPNVSVAKEIEEAFSNLVNQAVQYASAQKNSRQG